MTDELFLIEGRINRKKYGIYNTAFLITFLILGYSLRFLANFIAESGYDFIGILLLAGGFTLKIFLTLLLMIITYKRFHDVGLNGIFTILAVIPYVQIAVVLILTCVNGTEGANKYGENPLSDSITNKNKSFSTI
jgi:uncharacterized membrane protein YhaH (DUF805 family)